jgi:hypothetical protein
MFVQPDALRQRCIDLSRVLQDGHTLFQTFSWAFFDDRYRDRSNTAYKSFTAWYDSVLDVLIVKERPGFERICAKPTDPTWDETWQIACGNRPHPMKSSGFKRDLYNTRLLPYMEEMLDYVTTLRLHLFPVSPLPNSLRMLIADRFHKHTNYTIDAFFIAHGCLIDWRILPLKPTGKKSADRVLGWIDGLVLYSPDNMVNRLQAVYQSFRDYKGVPSHRPHDDIQAELATLAQAAQSVVPAPSGDSHVPVVLQAPTHGFGTTPAMVNGALTPHAEMDAEERQHYEALLRLHQQQLRRLELQVAGFGPLYVPTHMQLLVDEERAAIARLEALLAQARAPAEPTSAMLHQSGDNASYSDLLNRFAITIVRVIDPATSLITCNYCEGKGRRPHTVRDWKVTAYYESACSVCKGKGLVTVRVEDMLIPHARCEGSGKARPNAKTRDIKICSGCRGLGVQSATGAIQIVE